MKISTVVATYNGEKYILEQLSSIMAQNRKVDELVLVDDGSSDDTLSIVNTFITEHELSDTWKVFVNEQNLGYKANFKKALTLSSGDVVILCDQDDIWEENKVEEFEKVFSEHEVLAVNASFRFIDGKGDFLHSEENHNNNNLLKVNYEPGQLAKISFETIIGNNISPGCTMAVSRKLVELFLSTTKGIQPHDWELNILACIQDGLYFYNKKLTRYRIHGENEIGMTTDLNKAKPTPNLSYKQRCHNISERMKLGELMESLEEHNLVSKEHKDMFKRLYKYDGLRYECVVEKKPFTWIVMFFYGFSLKKYHYVRIRELIGDLFFSIKAVVNKY